MPRHLPAAAAALLLLAPTLPALAQPKAAEAASPASGGKPGPGGPMPGGEAKPGEAKPGEQKPGEAKPGEQKPGEAKPGEAKPGEAAPPAAVSRPAKPAFEVDPKELDIKPVDGKVRFNFHGQPWQGVLEWLAAVSGLSLDWQELPGDHLNLRTQRDYTLDEARDLLNQHLLARGYTMLRQGEVLTVVKVEKLDPALVPQVEPADLDQRDPHEFVQTTFPLEWLPAETAEEELKPLLSPKGKLTKLTATNRLHAIDVVANLLAVRDLLTEEQSGRGRERLVRSFKLKHARAADVKKLLEEFLGVEKKDNAMPRDPQQMQMRMQMQQMQAQQQAQQNAQGGAKKKKEAETSIIANPRENEVIAQAGPEEMAVIEATVKLLDAAPEANDTLERQLTRVRPFRLAQLDPETLMTMLQDMGALDPQTKLTADKKNHSLIVNGPLVDHVVIQQVIERLDGSDRSFEVIRLRRLPADYVAGTIRFMMGGEDDKKKNNDSYRRYYYYDPYGSNNEDSNESSGKFRVDADVENNRLLLWANPIELEEVQKLLVKLGEVRSGDGERSNVRVLNVSGEQADEFLRRLRESWSAGSTHPLVIEPPREQTGDPFAPESGRRPSATPPAEEPPAEQPPAKPRNEAKPTVTEAKPAVTTAAPALPDQTLVALADEPSPLPQTGPAPTTRGQAAEPEAVEPEAGAAPPRRGDPFQPRRPTPVKVTRGPDGKIVIRSDDPAALDAVEDLMYELTPPPKDYHVFTLRYPTTWAYGIVMNLEDFFEVDEKSSSDDDFASWYYGYPRSSSSSSETPTRLSARKKLKFIADDDSRTIVVQGGTADQLATIKDLIEMYDRPQSQNSGDLRVTKLFKIKHAKAETIAEAIKDVYRDLLSTNDRALQGNQNQQKDQPPAERSYTYVIGGDKDKDKQEAPIKFKGLLSIGIDKDSNTLVISASQGLMGDVGQLIESLDMAAQQKEAVSVVRSGGAGGAASGAVTGVPRNLSGRLKEIFGDKVHIVGEDDAKTSERPSTVPARE